MRPVIGQVIVRPARIRPNRIDVVGARAVEIDPARSQGFCDGYRGVALGGEILDNSRWRAGEGAAG